jgi:hypothetical protein
MKHLNILVLSLFLLTASYAQNNTAQSRSYKTAAGVKLWNGAGLNLKTFISEKSALEFTGFFNRFGTTISGLYEIHGDLNTEGNFKWYIGFGGHVNLFKNTTGVGVDGVIGLDYKISDLPLNIAFDWQPDVSFGIADKNGLNSRAGLAVRYTF